MQDTERSARDEDGTYEVVSGGSAAWDLDAPQSHYSDEKKVLIVQESFERGATVDEVAERHGVPPRRLSYWRKLSRKGELPAAGSAGAFAAVEVAPVPTAVDTVSVSIEARGVTVRLGGDVSMAGEWGRRRCPPRTSDRRPAHGQALPLRGARRCRGRRQMVGAATAIWLGVQRHMGFVTHCPGDEAFELWRAQLGHDWRRYNQDDEYIDNLPAPYFPARMKPLPERATEGRANPKGIPVLYLSTQRQTAMSEARPWLGSLVSCARFKTIRPLTIVDLSVCHRSSSVFFSTEPDASEREKVVWTQIDQAFSEPTTSTDNAADYVPTQVIAELFKSEGCDGIAYKSAFGDDGYNIVLFDPADATLTKCALFEAKSLEFSFERTGNPYWIEKDGTMKTISIEVIGPAPSSDESD